MNNLSKDSKCLILILIVIFCLITFNMAKSCINKKIYKNKEIKNANNSFNSIKTNMNNLPKNTGLNEIANWCLQITENYKNNL